MIDIEEEFARFNKIVHEEEKKYSKAEVKIKDYNYPYIYLTEDEIEDFNSVCLQSDFGFKATPFTEYFKLTSPSKYMNNEDESIDDRMARVEQKLGKFAEFFLQDKKFKKKKEKNEDEEIDMKKDVHFFMGEVNKYLYKREKKEQNKSLIEENNNNSSDSDSFTVEIKDINEPEKSSDVDESSDLFGDNEEIV